MSDTLLTDLLPRMDEALQVLTDTPAMSKTLEIRRVLDTARHVLMQPGGCEALEQRAQQIDDSGVFLGTDWADPQILVASLTQHAFQTRDPDILVLEAMSEIRLLAVARGEHEHPTMTSVQAHHFLTQVLALNLELMFQGINEARRTAQGQAAVIPDFLLRHLAERIGYEHIIDSLIEEIWRMLKQRPIQVDTVKQMVTQIAVCQVNPDIEFRSSGQGADRLVSALFGPTEASREDPGLAIYLERLERMDQGALQSEATGMSRAMHDTGLVSAYHVVLLRYLCLQEEFAHLVHDAMGLSSTGRECLMCYRPLVMELIDKAIHAETTQALYGLTLMLERGILYQSPVAPALWRQLSLTLNPVARERMTLAYGDAQPPNVRLLEGVLCMLGLPLGVGQGNNPTCQSARALSMWAYNDPDYLLQMVVWAARDDEIVMHFEGQPISSRDSQAGLASGLVLDLDPVSLLVVPHLDRIYAEMGRRCIGRDEDPHRWINPEFHGWWTGRGFRIAVDIATGHLAQLDDFLRYFYASYHPYFNDNQPVIHPQPAGIAVTDTAGRFIGWHAITIQRVGLDPDQMMRVYFYNPNNDSGQDWGHGVVVSTAGNGERFGEASLPFEQFASRLYIFHYDPLEPGNPQTVEQSLLDDITAMVHQSWAAARIPEI
ncbi:hypothetical protein [Pseudohongiella sp.]|uniref:Uncharacterized protein n=1 Tax=marine sediment metagenome TaxID=412755 RepID=A0A0F9Z0L3_9ZZZZ|nr:hypothetical protein [Pseudohongiella sp.]HDZ09841.1 hypothetical protein [Pseudohongiella sp.]HEA61545.1 hypothetical protein [Pseudohongiella sp.]